MVLVMYKKRCNRQIQPDIPIPFGLLLPLRWHRLPFSTNRVFSILTTSPKSSAGAGVCNHVLIFFINYLSITPHHQHAHTFVFIRNARGQRDICHTKLADECLHDGVVGRIVAIMQDARTVSHAVSRIILVGCNNPVVPSQIFEVHAGGVQLAVVLGHTVQPLLEVWDIRDNAARLFRPTGSGT